MKEVHILKSLKHPNIPIIYDIEEDENYSYIIEEYLLGESLKAYRMRLFVLSEKRIIEFISQICDLFQYLHTQNTKILYLDLKPENILVDEGSLKLLDFGAAVFENEYQHLAYELGTVGYMAPERLKHQADERSDIYSIGCLLYFLITGTLYQPSCVSWKWTRMLIRNRRLIKIMKKCLYAEPSRRFCSVREIQRELCGVSVDVESNKKSVVMSYCIAVAGSENRVGVTHVSLLLTGYLLEISKNCIYVEWNDSGCVEQFATYYPDTKEKDGYYFACGIRMQERTKWVANKEKQRFCFCVKDYGKLDDKNLPEFLEEEYRMVVLGTKPWEWKRSLHWIDKLCDCESVLFLLNLVEDGRVREGTVLPENSVFIPYVKDLFLKKRKGNEKKILDSLIRYVVKNKKETGGDVSKE